MKKQYFNFDSIQFTLVILILHVTFIQLHPIGGGGYGGLRGSKMVPTEVSSPHSYSTSIHTKGTVWPQYTMQQTDRAMYGNRPPIASVA